MCETPLRLGSGASQLIIPWPNRCVWQSERGVTLPPPPLEEATPTKEEADTDSTIPPGSPVLPRIKLPAEIMTHLRKLAKRQTLRLRPSIK